MNINMSNESRDRFTNVDEDVKRDPGFSNFGGRRTYVNPKYGETLHPTKSTEPTAQKHSDQLSPVEGGGGQTRGGGAGRDPSAPRDWEKVIEGRSKQPSYDKDFITSDAKERIVARAIYDIIGAYRTALNIGSEMGFDLTPDALREWLASYVSDQVGDLIDKYLDKGGYAVEEFSESLINQLWDQAVKWSLDRAARTSGISREEIQNAYDNIYQTSIQHYRDKAAAKRSSAIQLFQIIGKYVNKFIDSTKTNSDS